VTHPDYKKYRELSKDFPVVPVYREVLADLATPVSVFMKIDPKERAALLESVEQGETWGRFSIIGLEPGAAYESRGSEATIVDHEGQRVEKDDPPLSILDAMVLDHRSAKVSGLPRLAGAAIGFVTYDFARRIEKLPDIARDDLGLPDAHFLFFETAIVFDHARHVATLVAHTRPGRRPKQAYEEGIRRLDRLEELLTAPARKMTTRKRASRPLVFKSRSGKSAYMDGVRRIKEYIRAGDVFQVALSHRLEADLSTEPFDVYRALRVINPSPYMFFLRLGEWTIAGSSPEILVRRAHDVVQTRPIAGTRARGVDEDADRALETELKNDEKERAEHIMLVDLGRNDLGRISEFGTVETDELLSVERYSHVMHLVSNVRGRLDTGITNSEVLRSSFPAGTVSGAPKIRAMEIIEELEPLRRGLYAGAVGYVDFNGNMDTAIAIRTLLFRKGKAYLGVGAGIVADSNPESEWEETLRKASALVRACDVASRGLTDMRVKGDVLPRLDPKDESGGKA